MRELFLLEPGLRFLNHGSFGACPKPVFDALQSWQLQMERNPVEFLGRRSGALLADSRERLAQVLGAQAADLVYVPNATTGVNVVARSLDLKPGDEVLATDHEYGACDVTWQRVCEERGATYRRVTIPLPFDADCFAERVMAAATPRTRLVFASHLTSTTALIFPVAKLCARAREQGILSLIDGAHAPGHIPLDLQAVGADFYTGNCHKWMCAPKGAAFLHAREEHQHRLHATVTSWGYATEVLGHTGFEAYTGHTVLERRMQWQGTRDLAAWLSVPAAIDFQQAYHWDAVRQDCHRRAVALMHRLCQRLGLSPIGTDRDFGQMVPIPVPHTDGEALRRALFEQHRIEVPVTRHGDQLFVRVSVQGYTTDEELQALDDAL